MAVVLQPRDFDKFEFIARYGIVTRRQIGTSLGIPDRSLRRRLASLAGDGFICRNNAPMCEGMNVIPVYASTKKGLGALAQERRDDRYLNFPTGFGRQQNLVHGMEVAQTHLLFDQAIALQSEPLVSIGFWFHEDQQITPLTEPKRTTVMQGTIKSTLCRPDAVFSLKVGADIEGLFMLEEDRDTSWTQKTIKKKLPGFKDVFAGQKHLTHFGAVSPNLAQPFRILFVCPTEKRRDALRRETDRQTSQLEPAFRDCFRFIAKYGPENPLTAKQLLFEPIAYRCGDDTPLPLVRPVSVNGEQTANVTTPPTAPLGQGGQANGQLQMAET